MGVKRVIVFDTTLRDGEQTPGVNFNINDKFEIAKQLVSLGVDVIEAGFPAASNGDFEAVKNIADKLKGVTIAAMARSVKEDIDRASSALKNAERSRLHVFIATSDIHLKYKLKMSREEMLEKAVEMVKYAKGKFDEIQFSAEDASRTDWDFLVKVFSEVIDAGANVINVPDTVGYAMPREFGELIKYIRNNVPNIDGVMISAHCHNDLGMAVANSLSAIENGATQVEVTVNGIGERAGNAAMEEVVMALNTRKDYFGLVHGINTKEIYNTSKLVSELTGIKLQPNKAIVGANAFRHQAGIHQHGVINNRATYEIMKPEDIGIIPDTFALGKLSGRNAFELKVRQLGYNNLSPGELSDAFRRFKDLADRKKVIVDEDIRFVVEETLEEFRSFKEGEAWA
ncbi:2-isopropylmalate synthase [Thermoanaerobacter thermohydrosulfuricus]|uniref:2-isopropylmalate synthase n=4 Tax=Thermoanaerobacter TaxID=1754 RepID=B0KAH4_THEP3|nr:MULTISPECIES: 2-isopropylmalate synthase [Thermoanaerobacter]ABY93688.1 pyruvate carboxyltransferase [Thermoanaerobacter pseudethanolicus ATCC 33223]ADV78647.1 pyruvate carboxyltransferase [Thermoanaerobacter brockii subsp. finnii Ako-1]EMT39713.1 Isopropylmalate/homocitrate/citramalate synthase [Thermoanaerobacter thermohydrosulfuricus WC1]SDF44863.1 2-isopropylmalate synthase [Thermoanaerobacter thermohydrosulfuricus]SFE06426.1 2-isopropylmalate synthase [Thermoanaerobacter thermohydrosul